MTVKLYADGTTGKLAIYRYSGNDNPFSDPLNNIGALLFHSDLRSISIINTVSSSVTLGAIGGNAAGRNTYTLFAHGISGTPYVEGRITSINGSGASLPLAGSVPVATQASGYARWVHLGADATNVYLSEVYASERVTSYAAMTLGLEVYISDVTL